MEVEVRLFSHLRRCLPGVAHEGIRLAVQDGERIKDVLHRLGLSTSEPLVILLNGLATTLDGQVKPGDRISVFPPIGGG